MFEGILGHFPGPSTKRNKTQSKIQVVAWLVMRTVCGQNPCC
jgi:hypothetical protein